MNLPFTIDQFLEVFALYNVSIWPAQVVLNLAAVAAIAMSIRSNVPSKGIAGILAVLWAWTGVVYHLSFFVAINKAAILFGALFIVQALIFLYAGVIRGELSFSFRSDLRSYTGLIIIVYALLIYPLLGYLLGHSYPHSPTFGAPCPTTIFTFGLLLWTACRVPVYVYIVPTLWSLIGVSAAMTLGIREDLGLVVAGVAGAVLLFLQKESVERAVA